jgi:hypothetical protein
MDMKYVISVFEVEACRVSKFRVYSVPSLALKIKIRAYTETLEEPQHTKLCIGNPPRKREGESVHGECWMHGENEK